MPYIDKQKQKKAQHRWYLKNKEKHIKRSAHWKKWRKENPQLATLKNNPQKIMSSEEIKSEVFNCLENFNSEIQKIENQLEEYRKKQNKKIESISQKREEWCEKNRKKITFLFPEKEKLYKVTNPELIKLYRSNNWDYYYRDRSRFYIDNYKSKDFYFRPKNTEFSIKKQFEEFTHPYVKGEILDDKLKVIEESAKVAINSIEKLDENFEKNFYNHETKVYVMIDKNTGFYKIGRSNKPMYREKTLQSEKPTIELIFHCDARKSDERELHRMFKSRRVRGEWFDLTGSHLQLIKEYFKLSPHQKN